MRALRSGETGGRHGAAMLSLFVLAALLGRTLRAQERDSLIPALPLPPPVEARFLAPLEGSVRTTIGDVAFRTSIGHRVSISRIAIVADPAALRGTVVEASSIRIAGLEVIAPPDTVSTGFNAFMAFPIPRVHVDRLVLEDAFIGALAHPTQYDGRWLWWQDDIDVEIHDLRLGGDGPEGLRLVRADFAGERRDRPLRLTAASGTVTRSTDLLEADLTARLGESALRVDGRLRRSGTFDFDVAAQPLVFAEARGALPQLPGTGAATVNARIAADTNGATIAVERAVARVRGSTVVVSGAISTGPEGVVNDLRIAFPILVSADLDSLYGVALPGGGEWSGSVHADGRLDRGVAIDGDLSRVSPPAVAGSATARRSNGGTAPPRFTVEGTYRAEPDANVALEVGATGIPVRDGEAAGALRVSGPLDSLRVAGTLRGANGDRVPEVIAEIDASILDRAGSPRTVHAMAGLRAHVRDDPASPGREVTGTISGTAELAPAGRLDGRFAMEALPLAALPLPAGIDSVQGDATADLTLTGTLDLPQLDGTIDVRGGAFRVTPAGVTVSDLAGRIRVDDGVVGLDGLGARAGGGTLAFGGTLTLTGERRLADATLIADRVALFTDDSARVLAFAEAHATGALTAPRIDASAHLELPAERGGTELATARGSADLAGRTLELSLVADSLPLDVLPLPPGAAGVHGTLRAAVDIAGTLEDPTSRGTVALVGAGGRITRTGTELRDLSGAASLRDGLLEIDAIRGTAGGGALAVDGRVRIADGPRTLDLTLTIDSGRIVDTDSARVLASVRLDASGALEQPHVEGTVALLEGWIHEDNFARQPPIDTLSPPYRDLIARVPWIEDSRLRADAPAPTERRAQGEGGADVPNRTAAEATAPAEPEPDEPAFTGRIVIDVRPGIAMIDEDSEMYGNGRIEVTADAAGIRADGIYRVTGGYYAQYGEVFEIRGGAFSFRNDGADVTMRSEHRFQAPLGSWLTPEPNVFDRFPPLEFFAIGSTAAVVEEVRRLSLLPESRTELAALLLYREPIEPVTGWRTRTFWPPDDGGGTFGVSSASRSTVLLWSYIANESYDYLPLERVYLRGGIIEAGPTTPGRIAVGRFFQGGLLVGPLHAIVTQPLEGNAAPGLRLRYRIGAPELIAFTEPRFSSVAPAFPLRRVYTHGRRTGVGIRWSWEW